MFVATLLTNPMKPTLDRVTVESLRNAWGGGDAVWLDPGVAAEFPLESMPANRWEVWEALQSLRVGAAHVALHAGDPAALAKWAASAGATQIATPLSLEGLSG